MTVRRGLPLPALLALALGASTLAACDGASPAGDDLIGQGGDPFADALSVDDLAAVEVSDASAGSALGNQATQSRVLAGRVADPLFGDVAATAYVDFVRPTLPEEVRGVTPTSVSLILPVGAYTYGDPMAPVTLGIAEVAEPWRPRLDSVALEAGQAIATTPAFSTVTVPADTSQSLTVALSSSWVANNDSLLTGNDYLTRFRGLALLPPDGSSAVRGLTATGIRLRVVAAGDTLDYFASEVYTRVEAARPDEGTIVRDGTGRALGLTLPLADSLRDNALNRARLVVRVDTSASQDDAFARPLPNALALLGVRADSSRMFLGSAELEGGAFEFQSTPFKEAVQNALFGAPEYDAYEVVFPGTPATVNVAPFTSADLELVRVPPAE